jgi:hypothetical protein
MRESTSASAVQSRRCGPTHRCPTPFHVHSLAQAKAEAEPNMDANTRRYYPTKWRSEEALPRLLTTFAHLTLCLDPLLPLTCMTPSVSSDQLAVLCSPLRPLELCPNGDARSHGHVGCRWYPRQYRVQAICSSRRRLHVSFEIALPSSLSFDDSEGSCATLHSTVGISEIDCMQSLPCKATGGVWKRGVTHMLAGPI